jgi:hypothetical protein
MLTLDCLTFMGALVGAMAYGKPESFPVIPQQVSQVLMV